MDGFIGRWVLGSGGRWASLVVAEGWLFIKASATCFYLFRFASRLCFLPRTCVYVCVNLCFKEEEQGSTWSIGQVPPKTPIHCLWYHGWSPWRTCLFRTLWQTSLLSHPGLRLLRYFRFFRSVENIPVADPAFFSCLAWLISPSLQSTQQRAAYQVCLSSSLPLGPSVSFWNGLVKLLRLSLLLSNSPWFMLCCFSYPCFYAFTNFPILTAWLSVPNAFLWASSQVSLGRISYVGHPLGFSMSSRV